MNRHAVDDTRHLYQPRKTDLLLLGRSSLGSALRAGEEWAANLMWVVDGSRRFGVNARTYTHVYGVAPTTN